MVRFDMKSIILVAVFLLNCTDAGVPMRGFVSAEYDADFARDSAFFAATAYCDPEAVDSWDCGTPCEKHPQVSSSHLHHVRSDIGDTWGYTAFNEKTKEVIVGFRGTDGVSLTEPSVLNWVTNLDAVQISPFSDQPHVKVHRGFWLAYQMVADEIVGNVTSLLNEGSGVRVVGHSLGGALATLCAVDLRRKLSTAINVETIRVVTFGQPRVGNRAFVEYYTKEITQNHYRVVHVDDIVPHVPPEWIVEEFLHTTHEIWYHDDVFKNYTVCNDTPIKEDPSCSDSVKLWDWSVHDHMTYFIDISGSCKKSRQTGPTASLVI